MPKKYAVMVACPVFASVATRIQLFAFIFKSAWPLVEGPAREGPTNGRLWKPLRPRQVECFQRSANIMHPIQTLAIELIRGVFFPNLVT